MKVIFIHGMNQQHHSAASIRQRWLHILQKGIRKHRHDARFSYLRRHIHIPFYGDLLSHYNVRNILNAGTLMPQQWPAFVSVNLSILNFLHQFHVLAGASP